VSGNLNWAIDMSSPWHGLLANFALVALIVSIWTHVEMMLERRFQHATPVVMGLVFGFGAIALMMLPIRLEDGIFVDLRVVAVVLSGVFGGPVASLITSLTAIFYRWHLGGGGMPAGIFNIVVASAIGIAACRLVGARIPTVLDILKIAAFAAFSGLPSMFMMPVTLLHDMLQTVALPLTGAVFVAVLVAGMAIRNERRRNADARTNHIYHAIIDALPDSLNAKDLQGRFIAANPGTARLMKASSAEDLIGRTDFDFYPEETARIFRQEEYTALAAGGSSTIEQALRHHDGEQRWLSTLKTPFYDRRGAL
jgi:PAS domain S-box-containing protein